MKRTELIKKVKQMKTKEDLLILLNHIKHADMEEHGLLDKFRPFTNKQLNYFCNPNKTRNRYTNFKIRKKSGGFRQIASPRSKSFMMMLKAVNEILISYYIPSDYAMGFTEGRSVVTNATVHKGQNYVFNIDLKDFFPSIEQRRVWKCLQLAPFNFSKEIASLIAGLCSMRVKRDSLDNTKEHQNDRNYLYILPQGAPTSPIITNIICRTLDRRLAGLARRFNLNYTRYADDITFSSMHNVYQEDGEFGIELQRIIQEQQFSINKNKTRLQKKGARQEVTGIIVSHKLNVTQKYVRDIRNILYIWDRYGYLSAIAKFLPKYKSEKGHVKKGNSDLINVIDGKLMYLKMVKGEEDSVYVRLHDKFQKLVNKLHDANKTNGKHITYVETSSLLDFEMKNHTEITISYSNEPIIHDQEKEQRYKNITNSTPHRFAWFVFAGKKTVASVNKSIKKEEELHKEDLAISFCLDAKDNHFWLIHKQDKVTVRQPHPVDIDILINDLDSLINIQNG